MWYNPHMSCFEQTTIIIGLIISFFVALGTIGLAFFAFRQIREVNRGYKRKQLNEILEWAKSAIDWKYSEEYTDKGKNTAEEWFRLYISFSLKGESLFSIRRTGYIMSEAALALKQPSLDEKIKALNEEILKTHEKLGLLRNATHDALVINAKAVTPEFMSTAKALTTQLNNQKNAAEDLVSELGKLIPKY